MDTLRYGLSVPAHRPRACSGWRNAVMWFWPPPRSSEACWRNCRPLRHSWPYTDYRTMVGRSTQVGGRPTPTMPRRHWPREGGCHAAKPPALNAQQAEEMAAAAAQRNLRLMYDLNMRFRRNRDGALLPKTGRLRVYAAVQMWRRGIGANLVHHQGGLRWRCPDRHRRAYPRSDPFPDGPAQTRAPAP